MPKRNFSKGLYGVRKWEYEKLDDIDLLCEISISSYCEITGLCRVCKKHLKWWVDILMLRWENNKNIDFYSALEVVKNNKHFLNNSLDLSFDKDGAKEMIRRKYLQFYLNSFLLIF